MMLPFNAYIECTYLGGDYGLSTHPAAQTM
jgi:hypothetical protein